MFQIRWAHIVLLAALPLLIIGLCCFGPIETETAYRLSGAAYDVRPGVLSAAATIDPNVGATSFSLGKRAALEVMAGRWPLWNHYEGLGMPLLGEMQAAALFPPTLLLLLPHGQEIEQALLQFIAGLGAFLFLRRLGLGPLAALTGGLLFEVNGVFAWLRNAIFNPVAFLPWLLFCVESLWVRARDGAGFRSRIDVIGGGALAGALALYAGFPEVVYLYAPLLVLWTGFRFAGLTPGGRARFALDLGLTSIVAVALSAPGLLAFATFLPDGATGPHDAGFQDHVLHPGALLQYLSPYIYGPIFRNDYPPVWGAIGGYMGFAPVIAAAAAFRVAGWRGAKILLASWIVIALGVTHGAPLIHDAFMQLPLMKLAACYRYLNAGWIFAAIVLAALFVDRIQAEAPAQLRRAAWIGAAAGLLIAVDFAVQGWPVLPHIWDSGRHGSLILGFTALGGIWLAFLAGAHFQSRTWAARVVAGVLVGEAVVWFFVPFLSYPKAARLDAGAIAFLQQNAGYQRVVSADRGLEPNYGSAYGIPSINYNDVPVPKATVAYVTRRLDPTSDGTLFLPVASGDARRDAQRMAALRAHLQDYAKAGVKYVLADVSFGLRAPPPIPPILASHTLVAGEVFEAAITATEPTLAGVTVVLNSRGRDASGQIKTTACAIGRCVSATTEIALAQNSRPMLFAFPDILPVSVGEQVTILVERVGGEGPIGVALREDTGESLISPIPLRAQLPVYAGPSMAIFEVPGVRPYFSAPGCTLDTVSWNEVRADCPAPATLTRLEIFLRGWSVLVNGAPVAIGQEDATFQTVEIPAGKSQVVFAYRPPGFDRAVAAALAALAAVAAMLVLGRRPRAIS